MLRRLEISNFRCLKEVKVPLRPMTILVGPNDTGKTAFLYSIRFLLGSHRMAHSDYWAMRQDHEVMVTGFTPTGTFFRSTSSTALTTESAIQIAEIAHSSFLLPSTGPAFDGPGQPDEQGAPKLEIDGGNLPALIDFFLRRDRARFFSVVKSLQALIPGLIDLDVLTPMPDQRRINFVMDNGLRVSGNQISTGVKLLVFFVALAHHPTPPRLILLEEPENGIHPKRLGDVMLLLREITKGLHGGWPAQVILTTHSPYLVDCVNPKEDQVLVFRRNEDGSRTAEPVDEDRLKNFLDEFMLGEIWYNQGEEGLVARQT